MATLELVRWIKAGVARIHVARNMVNPSDLTKYHILDETFADTRARTACGKPFSTRRIHDVIPFDRGVDRTMMCRGCLKALTNTATRPDRPVRA